MVVYDFAQHRLSKFDTAGVLSAVPFLPGHVGPVDGVGTAARLAKASPSGMCADPSGNVYLLDKTAKVIRKVGPDGVISTPQLAWGKPMVSSLSFANGTLFGYTAQAIVQTPVP